MSMALLHSSLVPAPGTIAPVTITATPAAESWDAYVAGHPDATGYHQWAWRAVFERAFGHQTRYLAAQRDGRIVGVLPLVAFRSPLFGRFVVSLPFVNYGGVLADDDSARDRLLAEASDFSRAEGSRHIELRHLRRLCPDLPLRQHKVTMMMPLASSRDAAWTALDRKVRNQVRKAEKSGLVAAAGGADELDAFYRVFAHNMRDLGTPVYARRFFEEVLRASGRRAIVVLVKKEQTVVAGGIALTYRDTVEVPWASSLNEHRSLCPNHSLYWFVVQWAIEHGFKTLDFGRSTPNEGTFHFKEQWGAQPVPLFWEYVLNGQSAIPDHSPKNPKFRMAIEAWKRSPLWLTNALGPHIVRSIP